MGFEAARAIVHGMPTAEWKALHHTAATLSEYLVRMGRLHTQGIPDAANRAPRRSLSRNHPQSQRSIK